MPKVRRWNRLLREHFTAAGKPKRPFESLDDAVDFLRQTKQLGKKTAYMCSFCSSFHVGG